MISYYHSSSCFEARWRIMHKSIHLAPEGGVTGHAPRIEPGLLAPTQKHTHTHTHTHTHAHSHTHTRIHTCAEQRPTREKNTHTHTHSHTHTSQRLDIWAIWAALFPYILHSTDFTELHGILEMSGHGILRISLNLIEFNEFHRIP